MGFLKSATAYFFNIIVKDAVGNKAVYASASATTLADIIPPVPGNSGILLISNILPTGLDLEYAPAIDNVSPRSGLLYQLRQSLSNNIDTVARAEANGTLVHSYTPEVDPLNVTGLTPGTTYFFNVIVKDEVGNKAAYVTKTATTESAVLFSGFSAAAGGGASFQTSAQTNRYGLQSRAYSPGTKR